jgi:hypothetical protein
MIRRKVEKPAKPKAILKIEVIKMKRLQKQVYDYCRQTKKSHHNFENA